MKEATSENIKFLRERVGKKFDLKVTASQQICADNARVSIRNWQQWENNERKANASAWELINLKFGNETGKFKV